MSANRFTIQPLSTHAGAEVHGLDMSECLEPQTIQIIRAALHKNGVLFFRDQDLDPEKLIQIASFFGEPAPYPLLRGLKDYPEVTVVSKMEHERVNFGGIWHSDTTYLKNPPMGTILYALEVPEQGGDTLFSNQSVAFETLSRPIQQLLSQLTCINQAGNPAVSATREERIREASSGASASELNAEHPAVRTHPETGKPILYLNRAHTVGFRELSMDEGNALLEFLFRHQNQPEFCCRFSWCKGSLAFWDNCTMQHYPVNDYHGQRRIMHRVTLKGERPFQDRSKLPFS